MNKELIRAYSIQTDYTNANGLKLTHVFVVSTVSNNNWNCFGRGAECIPTAQQVSQGLAYAKWADLINGTDSAGLTNRITGVCHNVANRLLVLAGTDVSGADGDSLAILMYGKYGFNVDQYVERVKTQANAINSEQPGTISDAEIDGVINQITGDLTDELAILERDFQAMLQPHNENLTDVQKNGLTAIYNDFHTKRQQAWAAGNQSDQDIDFQNKYEERLKPILLQSLTQISALLGPDQYKTIFGLLPEQATKFLIG
jgi:hypothetical protein